MCKKINGFLFAGILAFSTGLTAVSAETPSDVEGSWAEKEITELVNEKIINGFPDGTFRPKAEITRAEFIQIIANMFPYKTSSSSFKDVSPEQWYYDAISKGSKNGIVKGYPDNTFKPNENISRQDIAVILDRVLQQEGDYKKELENSFKDSKDVNPYAQQSINRMAAYGLVNGKTPTEFKPNDMAKRAEAAAMIYRAIELFESNDTPKPDPTPDPEPTPTPDPEPTPEPEPTPDPDPEPTPDPEPVEKDYRDMTLEELKEEYGTYILIERVDGYSAGTGITERDLMDRYYQVLHGSYGDKIADPVTYMKEKEEELVSLSGFYSSYYPKYEVISYRGKSFIDSVLYDPDLIKNFYALKYIDLSILPSNPTIQGQILADIHTYSDSFGVYSKGDTKLGEFDKVMYQTNGTWMVDLKGLFENFGSFKQDGTSITIENGDNVLELKVDSKTVKMNGTTSSLSTNVSNENGVIFAPIHEVSELLGLSTRTYEKGIGRIEVANFRLEADYK